MKVVDQTSRVLEVLHLHYVHLARRLGVVFFLSLGMQRENTVSQRHVKTKAFNRKSRVMMFMYSVLCVILLLSSPYYRVGS